jgi:hypothetical protein
VKLNLLKGFAAVAMLCMVGAVFATPVALGDLGYGLVYFTEKYMNKQVSGDAAVGVLTTTTLAGAGAGWQVATTTARIGATLGAAAGPTGLVIGAVGGFFKTVFNI